MITKYSFPLTRWQWFEMHGLDKDWRRKVPLIEIIQILIILKIFKVFIVSLSILKGFVFIPFLDLNL